MSFSEWREVELEEVIELVIDYRGKTPKKLGGDWSQVGYRALSAKNIKTGRIVQEDAIRYLDSNLYTKWMKEKVNRGDILMTSEAPFGELLHWDSDEKIVLSQRLFCLRTNKKVDSKYLYYYMTTNRFQKELDARATGTTVRGLRQPQLLKCKIEYPPIKDQEAIANILSSMDERIRVNNQINKTLENMAQAIFKQWFVDFEFPNEEKEPYKSSGGEMIESELGLIPKGWVVGKLDDIATIVMGQSPKGTSYNEVGEGEVFYQGRTDFSSRFPIRRLFTTEPKRMANDGDVLMSVRAPVGDLNVANERCCIGRGLSAISSSADLSSYILYVMHDLRERLNVYNGEGTVFGSINQKDLKSIKVISSCDNKTEIAFDDLIQPIDRMIRNNEDETRRLINLRDRLLPKLLSGEIRVPLDEEGDVS